MVKLLLALLITAAVVVADSPAPDEPMAYKEGGKAFRRLQTLKARVAATPDTNLLFVGDSITHYWEHRGRDAWKRFSEYNPLNFGAEGDRTHNVLYRLETGGIETLAPKTVILLIGTNNLGLSRQSPEQTIRGVVAVVDKLQTLLPKSRLIVLGILPRGNPNAKIRRDLETVNTAIAELAERPRVDYLDLAPHYLDEDKQLRPGMMTDGLHLSAKGYHAMADALLPLIENAPSQ